MTILIATCTRCLAQYELTRKDTLKGYSWWSKCPGCRPQDEAQPVKREPRRERNPTPGACSQPVPRGELPSQRTGDLSMTPKPRIRDRKNPRVEGIVPGGLQLAR
jgi:hypothetical protein